MADNTARPAYLDHEGACMGAWMFTSGPIRGGTHSLCTMSTRTHMLNLVCQAGFEDGALVRLIAAAEGP